MTRLVNGMLWMKILALALVFAGFTEKWSAITVTVAVAIVGGKHIRDGMREQVRATPEQLTEWLNTDLVWDNAVWINPETPEQGVVRLAGPYRTSQTLGRSPKGGS